MSTNVDDQTPSEVRVEAVGTVPSVMRAAAGAGASGGGAAGGEARTMRGLADAPPITPRRRKPTARGGKGKRWGKRGIGLLLVAALGAGAPWYWQPLRDHLRAYMAPKNDAALDNVQTYVVKRGALRITVVEEGKLKAVKNYPVITQAYGKIAWLAEAGAKVKKGDKLVSLDQKQFERDRAIAQGELDAARQTLVAAEQQVPIAKSTGEAAVAAAHTKLEEAELALKQFSTITAPKALNDMDTQINDQRNKLADSQKKKSDAQSQLDEKMLDDGPDKEALQQQLDLSKQTVTSLQKGMTTLEDQRKLYRAYNYPQELKKAQQAKNNAGLEVTKAEVEAKSNLAAKEADVAKAKSAIARYDAEVAQLDESIKNCTVTAPADGLVFYGNSDDRYYYDSDRIRVGGEAYPGNTIMTIPDQSSFQVNVPIAEIYRGRITIGMPATVTIDAIPELVLEGSLESVATVARSKISWDSSSPQVFDATINLARADDRMVAGMTVRAEVVTASLSDVLYSPVEAIFNDEGKTVAFVWVESKNPGGGGQESGHVEKRPVRTGLAGDHFVELKKGVAEGERLLLSRPASYVTPRDFREQVEAMFPATAPRPYVPPASAPATSQAASTTTAPNVVATAATSAPATTAASDPAK